MSYKKINFDFVSTIQLVRYDNPDYVTWKTKLYNHTNKKVVSPAAKKRKIDRKNNKKFFYDMFQFWKLVNDGKYITIPIRSSLPGGYFVWSEFRNRVDCPEPHENTNYLKWHLHDIGWLTASKGDKKSIPKHKSAEIEFMRRVIEIPGFEWNPTIIKLNMYGRGSYYTTYKIMDGFFKFKNKNIIIEFKMSKYDVQKNQLNDYVKCVKSARYKNVKKMVVFENSMQEWNGILGIGAGFQDVLYDQSYYFNKDEAIEKLEALK